MNREKPLTLVSIDLSFARLTIDVQGLLLWWLLDSLSLNQLLALAVVLLLGLSPAKAPSSCRRSPS